MSCSWLHVLNYYMYIIVYHHIVDTSNHQPYYQGQEYSSVLAIQEEGARGTKEKVLQAPKRFSLPEKSELVTSCSHPYHTAYHVEDQHVTLTQYQQFSEILAAKGVSEETIMKFIYTGARYVPILHYRISELLSPIVVVIDNAGRVFEMENIWKGLPAVIEQVLMMLVCYVNMYIHLAGHYDPSLYKR